MSQRAHEPGSDLTSHSPDGGKLTDWDRQLSVIAAEAADLQQELSRLRAESEAVAQLLEQRENELEQKTASLTQLTAERDQTEKSLTAANASLSEAQALLKQDRERIASLAQQLELRQAEQEHATVLEQELDTLRARVVELEQQLELRQAEQEHPTVFEQELDTLRARVVELEELETQRAALPPPPRSHLRLVALATGYALSESAEPPPRVGELLWIDGRQYAVARSGRSPLPGDPRPCVLLLAEPTQRVPPHSPDDVEPAAGRLASR